MLLDANSKGSEHLALTCRLIYVFAIQWFAYGISPNLLSACLDKSNSKGLCHEQLSHMRATKDQTSAYICNIFITVFAYRKCNDGSDGGKRSEKKVAAPENVSISTSVHLHHGLSEPCILYWLNISRRHTNTNTHESGHEKTYKNGMCAKRRLRSAWAFAQSDQSLCCALNG